MEKQFLDIPFEVDEKSINEKEGTFNGYGSTFGGKPDTYGDVILQGAFTETIAKGGRNGNGIAFLWQHNWDAPIGTWESLSENKTGLLVKGKTIKGVQRSEEALLLLRAKAIKGLSIGYTVPKGGSEDDENARIRLLKKIDLWEISLVTFPANTRAIVTRVKSIIAAKTPLEMESILMDMGLSVKESQLVISKCKTYLGYSNTRGSLVNVKKALERMNFEHDFHELLNKGE